MTLSQFEQIRRLMVLFGIPGDDVLKRARRISGRNVASLQDLDLAETAWLIREMEPCPRTQEAP